MELTPDQPWLNLSPASAQVPVSPSEQPRAYRVGAHYGPQASSFMTPSDHAAAPPSWPRHDYRKAYLLRYFVETLAPMFDLCDSECHFARVVPLRALECPALFSAIMCVSAKRLSKVGDYDRRIGDDYQQNCLELLIPALSNSASVGDENLLAAVVILRYVEEIDITGSDEATESHLVGARAFLSAQDTSNFTGLRLATFWLALRQEIYMGFVHGRSVDSELFLKNQHLFLNLGDDDCSYANRIMFPCLACLRHCYDVEKRSADEWEGLEGSLERWWREKPKCYEPLWTNWEAETFFPEVWYLNDAVVTAIQHYHLARVLLVSYSPKIPRLGPEQMAISKLVEEGIKKTVREVCGMAMSHSHMAPHFVTASIAITMAGDRFSERHEQEELQRFLARTDKVHGWPTESTQYRLKEAWS